MCQDFIELEVGNKLPALYISDAIKNVIVL